jgi:hypothetical protein
MKGALIDFPTEHVCLIKPSELLPFAARKGVLEPCVMSITWSNYIFFTEYTGTLAEYIF